MKPEIEQLAIYIIANAGDSKCVALEAIECAKSGDFDEARKLLDESKKALLEGHKAHTDLIVADARESIDVNMLLVHASNHLSVAEVTVQFAEIIIDLLDK